MSNAGHLDDEVLERYAMSGLSESDAESVEDHISFCSSCLDRLDFTTAYVEGMRTALKNAPVEQPRTLKLPSWLQIGWGAPAWAAGAVAAAALFFVTFRQAPLPAPAMVLVEGTRGTSTLAHGTGPFDFEVFMPASGPVYHVELLDDGGRKRWSGDVPGKNGTLHAVVRQRLAEGQYYLHVTEPVSGSIHDYAVKVMR